MSCPSVQYFSAKGNKTPLTSETKPSKTLNDSKKRAKSAQYLQK
jgi:hypothetical protein